MVAGIKPDVDLAILEKQGMTERDQLAGFFCRQDARYDGGLEHRTLFTLETVPA